MLPAINRRFAGVAVAGLAVGAALFFVLKPAKDYKQLALGTWEWQEPQSNLVVRAEVSPDVIVMGRGKHKHRIFYELFVDRDPMEIEVWRTPDKRRVYRGLVVFKDDDKVEARKVAEPQDEGDYFAEMTNKMVFTWHRVVPGQEEGR